MKKNSAIRLVWAAIALSFPSVGWSGPRAVHARREAQKQEMRDEARETQRKVERYLANEGIAGRISWKEYVVNPAAPGVTSLVVILDGRSSVPGEDESILGLTTGLEPLIMFARQKAGKTVILVPKLPADNVGRGAPAARQVAGRKAKSHGEQRDELVTLLFQRANANNVTADHIYGFGVSGGGHVLYTLLNQEPELFVRAVIVGAAGQPDQADRIVSEVLAFHGSEDAVIASTRARAMIDAINAKHPGRATLTVLKGKDHAHSIESAVSRRETWKWLFK